MTCPLIRRGNLDTETDGRKMIRRQREKTAMHKPRREAWSRSLVHSPEKALTLPAPDSDSQLPELLQSPFCWLSHPVCGTLLAVALAD